MKFENILEEIDGFGPFQIVIIVLLCAPRIVLPCHYMLNNFIAALPPHRCDISTLENGGLFRNLTQQQRLTVSLPLGEDGGFRSCEMFAEPQFQLLVNGSKLFEATTVPCQSGWVYDNSTFTSTLATEWDLVCDRKSLAQTTSSIFFFGVMIGSIAFGFLSDRPGRQKLALGTWNVTSLGGKEPELVREVERYQLDLVGPPLRTASALEPYFWIGVGLYSSPELPKSTLGRRSMIDVVIVSSDLRLYVLDTRVKRGAELSTDHHLVVSWVEWRGKPLDRPGKPKRVVRVNWERLEEAQVQEAFNSHLRRSFSGIPVETPVVREAIRLKKEAFRDLLSRGTPEAVARYRQARRTAASAVAEAKQLVWEKFGEDTEKDFQAAPKLLLENCPTPQEGEAGNHPSCVQWIPESARWLLAHGKVEKAKFYLDKCAEFNKRGDLSDKIKLETLSSIENEENKDKNYTYLDLIKTPKMRKLTLLTGIVWYGVASTYYGISLNISGLGLNIYLTHFIYAAIEVPAKLMVYCCLNIVGRRKCQAGTLLLTGLSIAINILLPQDTR
ncbi:solute carrier family 22 member 7-like [Trematomus bernacchii]|uniref:solute carrier family 22 member 7-like n=1 Tax=Trematomus bernacchii TaxID=40690 RepID=UPI00146EC354|nr:solute carrier family 22 member 7-like [Trematomus bernacchii]